MEKLKVNFGLAQQGHIQTIEKMLDQNGYGESSWEKIGKAIHWQPETAMRHYIKYLRNERLKPENDSKSAPDEPKHTLKLNHWSENKGEYEEGLICGLNCGCKDLECKF